MEVPPVAVAMGSSSAGPLLISGVDWPRLGETMFFDVEALRPYAIPGFNKHGFFETGPGIRLWASADGRVFTSQQGGRTQGCRVAGRMTMLPQIGGLRPVPGPDGSILYTDNGRYAMTGGQVAQTPVGEVLPATSSPWFLALPRRDEPNKLYIHVEGGDRRVVAVIPGNDFPLPGGPDDRLGVDRRYHLIPAADTLVTIPSSDDRFVLRRLRLQLALLNSDVQYVYFSSVPREPARPGQRYTGRVVVTARNAVASVSIPGRPFGGMTLEDGQITWDVPQEFAGHEVLVHVHVELKGSGRINELTFPLVVLPE
jgi:hypothetical protein